MHIKYYTKHGSVYIHTIDGPNEYWIKEDPDGEVYPIAEALHISRAKLQELVNEYPSTLLDKTFCFDIGAEKEFFEDAKREPLEPFSETEETVIFFLIKRADEHYGIGCSSQIVKVEKTD